MPRLLYDIAKEIEQDWTRPYSGAIPYIKALKCVVNLRQTYVVGPASSIVEGFLANAMYWRGRTAKRVKAELKAILEDAKARARKV